MAAQQILARGPGQLSVRRQGSTESVVASFPEASSFLTAEDGSRFFVAYPDRVDVHSTANPDQKLASFPEPGVILMALSPAGDFLVTCTKPGKAADTGEPVKNLKVWDLGSPGSPVFTFSLRTVSKDTWPTVQWAGDDSLFVIVVPNTAMVYSRADGFSAARKITIKGIASCAVSPTTTYGRLLGAFIPEAKGSPASVGLYDMDGPAEPTPRCKKGFFRTQGARLMWNATGSALLVLSYADFDATNQSYYGEQKLHYLPADPKRADAATTVPLPKEGPVHDVQWSPKGDFFLTVAGFMPAKATLWDAACKPIYDFGSGPWNMVRWNPFGRFLAIMGFGNLPGDILFFDKKASGTCKQMGTIRLPSVSAEWSPDGRHLLVATTAPRLRVDNKFAVLTYYGEQVAQQPFDMLFEAAWVPAPAGTYEDRPQSPERLAQATSPTGAGGGARPAAGAARPAGYVPPHLRGAGGVPGSGGGGAPAPMFSLGHDANDKGGRIASARASKAPVPGFEFVDTKAASKNAKKRANKKNKTPGAGGDDSEGDEQGATSSSGQQQQSSKASSGAAQAAAAGVANLSVSEGAQDGEGGDAAKRVRALQKKLRQIQQLKERLEKEGEKALDPDQLSKIKSESAVIEEIKSLGGTP